MNRIPLSSLKDKKSKVNVKNPRCLELFLNSCKNNATRETYVNHFNAFLKHVGKDHESLLMLSDSELNIILEDYVMFCSSNDRYARSSIKGIFASIEKFLVVNDKMMNKKKLMMFLPEQKKTSQRAITTEEILLLLLASANPRSKAIVHLFCATGCRPEGMADLKMKDIDFISYADGFTGIIFYSGSKNEFQHFCHSEATDALNDYLEKDAIRKNVASKVRDLIGEKKPRIVWCGMLTSTKRKELIESMLFLKQSTIDGSNTILQFEQPEFHWKSMKQVEKEIDIRSKECRDCGSPFERDPYERGMYQGNNEPVVMTFSN